MGEDGHWPNQPRAGRAEVARDGLLQNRAKISSEMRAAAQGKHGGKWIGIWSPHPVVTNLLCLSFRRSHRLREVVARAEPISLDVQPHAEHPFLIILDTLPLSLEGTATSVRRAKTNFPQSKLVGLVDRRGGDIVQLFQLGVSGLVQTTNNLEADLASAISTIHRGSIWVPESVLVEHRARVQSLIDCGLATNTVMSAREAQVLDAVIWGQSNKEIARILAITERTVKFHVSNILSKLGLERRTELVRWHEAIRGGVS
jgi:two-component system, NarL family, response regulator